MDNFPEFDPAKLPKYKVELHVHLDGSVRLTTIWELAQKKGIDLGVNSLEKLYEDCRIKSPTTLCDFLKPFSIFLPVIVGDPVAIERIAYEFCEDAARQCVVYCEVRYCPHLLSTTYGRPPAELPPLTPRDVVMCVNLGLSRGSADFNVSVRSILCCFRGHHEWSNEILDLCIEFQPHGVVGIDIAGDEAKVFATPTDLEVFKRAASLGIHRTVHAGEAGPNVFEAVHSLFAERIGHGYRVVEEGARVYDEVRALGIHFETCPYSSCLTGAVCRENLSKHPIVRFAEDNVKFSISRDDPTLIQKTLDDEYEFLRGLGLKEVHIVRANFSAAEASFLPPDEKQQLIQQLREVYGTEPGNGAPPVIRSIPPKVLSGCGDCQ